LLFGRDTVSQADIEREISEVIGSIYDCTADPALWPDTLARIANFCGGQATCLAQKNAVNLSAQWLSSYGVDPVYVGLHTSYYTHFDPMAGLLLHDQGLAVPIDRLISRKELTESKFFREWTTPQHLFDVTSVIVEKSLTDFVAVCLMTDKSTGFVDETMNGRLTYLAPHLQRAYKIGSLIQIKSEAYSAFAQTIDGLAAGVLLISAGGKILHANPAAREALVKSGCIASQQGRLTALNSKNDRSLQAAIAAAGMGDRLSGAVALQMMSRSGERFLLHTLPLARTSAQYFAGLEPAVAAVFISPAGQYQRTLPEVIAAAYNLTPTELRVLFGIAEIGGAQEVADALGLAVSTVKTHLGRIYSKTGGRRHADLAKLVAGFSTPLARQTGLLPPDDET
jgi:DNA-binding CsgD family transcriptional regulator/PAS domain-containing protein